MKTIIRSACVVLAVAALSGCGVPKEDYQKLQDKATATEQQLARAQQDIQSLQNALQQKDAELSNANQQFQAQKQAYEGLIKRQASMIEAAKGGAKATPAAKGKAAKTPAKKASASH